MGAVGFGRLGRRSEWGRLGPERPHLGLLPVCREHHRTAHGYTLASAEAAAGPRRRRPPISHYRAGRAATSPRSTSSALIEGPTTSDDGLGTRSQRPVTQDGRRETKGDTRDEGRDMADERRQTGDRRGARRWLVFSYITDSGRSAQIDGAQLTKSGGECEMRERRTAKRRGGESVDDGPAAASCAASVTGLCRVR